MMLMMRFNFGIPCEFDEGMGTMRFGRSSIAQPVGTRSYLILRGGNRSRCIRKVLLGNRFIAGGEAAIKFSSEPDSSKGLLRDSKLDQMKTNYIFPHRVFFVVLNLVWKAKLSRINFHFLDRSRLGCAELEWNRRATGSVNPL